MSEKSERAAHTPGPWTVARNEGPDEFYFRRGYYSVEPIGFPVGSLRVEDDHDALATVVANAHLIAAAPDLLHAVKWHAEQVYAILSSDYGGDIPARIIAAQEHVAAWRSVVAKAEGR